MPNRTTVLQNLSAMLVARGFVVNSDQSRAGATRTEFIVRAKRASDGAFAVAFFYDYPSAIAASLKPPPNADRVKLAHVNIGHALAYAFENYMPSDNKPLHVIVLQEKDNPFPVRLQAAVHKVNAQLTPHRVNIFAAKTFAFDLMKHKQVPTQWLFTGELPKTWSQDGPKIFVTDPVAEWLDAQEGQVIAEARLTPARGAETYYRRVVCQF